MYNFANVGATVTKERVTTTQWDKNCCEICKRLPPFPCAIVEFISCDIGYWGKVCLDCFHCKPATQKYRIESEESDNAQIKTLQADLTTLMTAYNKLHKQINNEKQANDDLENKISKQIQKHDKLKAFVAEVCRAKAKLEQEVSDLKARVDELEYCLKYAPYSEEYHKAKINFEQLANNTGSLDD